MHAPQPVPLLPLENIAHAAHAEQLGKTLVAIRPTEYVPELLIPEANVFVPNEVWCGRWKGEGFEEAIWQ